MERRAPVIPNELRQTGNEDQSMTASIHSELPNFPADIPCQSLKLRHLPLRQGRWTSLSNCMKMMAKYGCHGRRYSLWMRRILDRLSSLAIPEQLPHLFNGYADLHKVLIYVIRATSNSPIIESDIRCYRGTSSKAVQEKRRRNLAFITHDFEKGRFALWHATSVAGHPQACFETDDMPAMDHVIHDIRTWNSQMLQNSTSNEEYANNSSEYATDREEPDQLPSPASEECETSSPMDTQHSMADETAHGEGDLRISGTDDRSEDSPYANTDGSNPSIEQILVVPAMSPPSGVPLIVLDDEHEMTNDSPTETSDHQPVTREDLAEREQISKNIRTGRKRRQTESAPKHHLSTKNGYTHPPIPLSKTTIQPIPSEAEATISVKYQCEPVCITKEPKPHRHIRMLADLAKKDCPLVQAGERKQQKVYPEIKIPNHGADCIRIRAVTENKLPHALQCVAPENATVDLEMMATAHERSCLQCDRDSFDPSIECVYALITDDERQKRRKEVRVHLFNWKQYGPASKEMIVRENLRLCRLEIQLCAQTGPGSYRLLSPPAYTSVIDQDEDVEIEATKIEPKVLCGLGGQIITVPLSADCRKKDLHIEYNEKELKLSQFKKVKKTLQLTSPCQLEGLDHLHLVIQRMRCIENSSERMANSLYDGYLPYLPHDAFVHTCPKSAPSTTNNGAR